jgi:hypothetical protein
VRSHILYKGSEEINKQWTKIISVFLTGPTGIGYCGQARLRAMESWRTVITLCTIGQFCSVAKRSFWTADTSDAAKLTVFARWADVAVNAISWCGCVDTSGTVVTRGT